MSLVAVGACYVDTILTTPHYPGEDEKLRASSISHRRGGNCPNTLEVLQQLIAHSKTTSKVSLNLVAVLPAKASVASQQILAGFGPGAELEHCIYREQFNEPASSYIIKSQASGSRTIVNYNELPEMTFEEFTAISDKIGSNATWFHFEGRIPEVTLACMRYLRQCYPSAKISVEAEKPGRPGLQELANEADVIFYSKSWAQGQGYASAAECLRKQRPMTRNASFLCCTWGEDGAVALDTQAGELLQSPAYTAPDFEVVEGEYKAQSTADSKMADPLSITASVLAVISAAVQSTRSLYETVQRYKDRNKTLRRLQDELEDLINILDSLTEVTNAETSMLALLKGPIDRCSQICHEFEQSMKAFSGKSKTGFRDWTKMEFRRGDINEFIDTIAGYKSTISVGLGTITMHISKVSQQVLQEYNEMIKDTAYNLEVHLQQIDEKMARLTVENTITSDISIDLNDEREVTKQCLRICEDARSFIESLTNREPSLLLEPGQNATEDEMRDYFEAQLLTRQTLDKNRQSFSEIIGHLQGRLESLVLHGDSGNDKERLRLQEDINISKQCLEVCKVASEVSRQKIYRIGEVIADGDSDQVVVTTLADLFDIKKAQSKGNSAQLVGSMTDESLRHLAEKRYSSRFGAVSSGSNLAGTVTISSPSATGTQRSKHASPIQTGNEEQSPGPRTRHDKPSPNEMRKRGMGGATD
ncbi:hypothetical protein CNMCM5623_004790 [Aspergillus felis]|uniref:Azaphilone pigments biosynthesis cluster protein L N-terminal domain-containing protein n=1 Tax=Aspergillus felis TaxID=1287682 RepID=A0A8H6V3L2_9EURO|nr:hypothetical protein CNMCM5623_004790 [Aspergillus felis]